VGVLNLDGASNSSPHRTKGDHEAVAQCLDLPAAVHGHHLAHQVFVRSEHTLCRLVSLSGAKVRGPLDVGEQHGEKVLSHGEKRRPSRFGWPLESLHLGRHQGLAHDPGTSLLAGTAPVALTSLAWRFTSHDTGTFELLHRPVRLPIGELRTLLLACRSVAATLTRRYADQRAMRLRLGVGGRLGIAR
jgi:hypothetical protein